MSQEDASQRGKEVATEDALLDSDPPEDPLLQDLPADFFQDIKFFENSPSAPPSPYSGSTQPSARLRKYIARYPYIAEPQRHYLGALNQVCSSCGAALWPDETPGCC